MQELHMANAITSVAIHYKSTDDCPPGWVLVLQTAFVLCAALYSVTAFETSCAMAREVGEQQYKDPFW